MNENPGSGEQGGRQQRNRMGMGMDDVVDKITKGKKGPGIAVAIIMIVLGVLFFVLPMVTTVAVMYVAVIGFIIYGIFEIVTYFQTPSDYRNGWKLASGILFVIIGLLLLLTSASGMVVTFAFLLGFLAMFSGINRISASMALKKSGEQGWGWVLTSGIINLILSIFFLITPFMAVWILDFILGIYLIVGGIALLAEALSGHLGNRL